jgi:hypothetical protein
MNDIISNPDIITSPNIVTPYTLLDNATTNNNLSNVSAITNNSLNSIKSANYINIIKYIVIILLLSLLGFNLFKNLGTFVDKINGILKNIFYLFEYDIVSKPLQKNIVGMNKNTDEINNIEEVKIKNTENNNSLDNILNNVGENLNIENTQSKDENNAFKSGYCFVGEDRGYRTCIKVGEVDKCMSGDIFPNKDICINPNLRI